ncbi:uncharacterized protein LOC132296619 [Cornus florida]|uniref:uncharacterized protein LOC132296619 n=1 Tax=Cornus florida TaxID=4283 RepID=UPI00289D08A8|nr:uncharacterized protein LOC132296619 [Cornus florida]
MGDLNTIREHGEKIGGNQVPQRILDEFNNTMHGIGITDLPMINGKLTWCNRQDDTHRIYSKLDRGLDNLRWLQTYPNSNIYLTAASLSDHYAIVSQIGVVMESSPKPFKFLKVWQMQEGIEDIITKAWQSHIGGNPLYSFTMKLRKVKKLRKVWNTNKFGSIHAQVYAARTQLEEIQMKMLHQPMDSNVIAKEAKARRDLELALANEEILIAQKSRTRWLKDNDKCIEFFYRRMVQHRANNAITMLHYDRGNLIQNQDDIKTRLVDYYQGLYASENRRDEELNVDNPRRKLTLAKTMLLER